MNASKNFQRNDKTTGKHCFCLLPACVFDAQSVRIPHALFTEDFQMSRFAFGIVACCFVLAAPAHGEEKLGTRRNPIKFAFSPSSDASKMMATAEPLRKCLEQKTGLFYDITIPPSYIVVVESFGSKKVDLAMTTSSSYAKALEKKYDVEPLLRVVRKGEDTYKGAIFVRADSKISKIEDLKGKKFAFVDPASGSGYIFPKKMLLEKGVKLAEEVFANKHDVSITMVYQKQVDAAAAFFSPATDANKKRCEKIDQKTCFANDARNLLKTQFSDIVDKVKILALTEAIPNDPIVVRTSVSADVKTKMKSGLKTCFEELNAQKQTINDVDTAVETSGKDYEPLLKVFKDLKVDLDAALAPKKK
jgi:phosphonate transport system substrate-binding protein